MKYYQDITIIPCFEISVYHIWEKVFRQVHLAIVDSQSAFANQDNDTKYPIGVAFPQYRYTEENKHLGKTLRLFADTEQQLIELQATKWLSKMLDYVHIKSIRMVPDSIKSYNSFWSPSTHSNIHRLARRKAKRQKISLEQAMKELHGFKEEQLDYPYIHCNSMSSQQRFRKFIKIKNHEEYISKGFNSYGLSSQSTLPNF